MGNTIMIKIVLLAAILIMFLQCIYVLGAYKNESEGDIMGKYQEGSITKARIQRIPEPQLPAL